MNYQEFIYQVELCLVRKLGSDHKVTIRSVTKNNDLKLDALTILEPGRHIAPTIYLNPYYEEMLQGNLSLDQVVERILSFHRQYMPSVPINPDFFSDFDAVRKHIAYKLIHYRKNQEVLQTIPHIPYLDLAICFYCAVQTGPKSQATVLIHNEHLKMWDIKETTLYETARNNTPILFPHTLTGINSFLKDFEDPSLQELTKDPSLHIPMYILSNKYNLFGASCILYDDLLNLLSKELNSSFYVLPSSIHEVILVPSEDKRELDLFTDMVQEVNQTHVAPIDILSDHAYFYDRISQELSMD